MIGRFQVPVQGIFHRAVQTGCLLSADLFRWSRCRGALFTLVAALGMAGAMTVRADTETLTVADVNTILLQAGSAAQALGDKCAVAVSDREGFILGVYYPFGTAGLTASPAGVKLQSINAIDKAGTAAYLSSDGEAFTSRTAGFIIQPHFPPGIANTAPGPLTGVGLSSLPFSDVNHFRNPNLPSSPSNADSIANTSLSGNPGGVPLYKNGQLVGGVGVDSSPELSALVYVSGPSLDESVAMSAQFGYGAPSGIIATNVLLNGIRLPYSSATGGLYSRPPLPAAAEDPNYPVTASTGLPFNTTTASPFPEIPNGTVRNQITGSALPPVNGQARLSAAEVTQILHQAALRAVQTRGAIRNPAGVSAEVFIVVVDYYNPSSPPGVVAGDNTSPPTVVPEVLGSFRTPDATLFSYDVAAQKARTALFFSNNSIALSSRSVGFLAQGTYPPGINNTAPGPYGPSLYGASNPKFGIAPVSTNPLFLEPAGGYGLQILYTINPSVLIETAPATPPPDGNAISTTYHPNPYLPNGITVFPGGFPLYRNGQLIGAVGVSGDGVDQDDIISASATVGFEAPTSIRADEFTFRGARLPYAKFPQNSTIGGY
jgi:uncharacterized protein GlcG (DUF336 family)